MMLTLFSGWLTQYNFVKDNFEKPEYQAIWGEDGLDTFTSCYYEALAVGALHPEAYVFTPNGYEWDPESLFRYVPRFTMAAAS